MNSFGPGGVSSGWALVVAGVDSVFFYNPQNGQAAIGVSNPDLPPGFRTTEQFQIGPEWNHAIVVSFAITGDFSNSTFFVYDSSKGSGGFVGAFSASGYVLESSPSVFPRDKTLVLSPQEGIPPFRRPSDWHIAATVESIE